MSNDCSWVERLGDKMQRRPTVVCQSHNEPGSLVRLKDVFYGLKQRESWDMVTVPFFHAFTPFPTMLLSHSYTKFSAPDRSQALTWGGEVYLFSLWSFSAPFTTNVHAGGWRLNPPWGITPFAYHQSKWPPPSTETKRDKCARCRGLPWG